MRQIWIFLCVTFLWSWGLWWPKVLVVNGATLPFGLTDYFAQPDSLAAWGPLVGALVSALTTGGFGKTVQLLKRGVQFRFAFKYYAVAFFAFPILIGGAMAIAMLMGESMPPSEGLANPAVLPIAFVFILFLGGPLQEEFGWRGVLLPRLLERMGPSLSSMLIGLVWGLWHLPLFFLPSQAFYYERPIWGLVLSTVLISFIFTWLYQRTNGSVFAVLVLHTMFNFTHYVFPTLQNDLAATILWGTQLLAVALIVWDWRQDSKKAA